MTEASKQLFKVVNTADPKQKSLGTFENKKDAKVLRDELNKYYDFMMHRVCRGKDHWKGESFVNSKNVDAESPLRAEERKIKASAKKKAEKDAKRKSKEQANADYGTVAQPRPSEKNQAAE